MQSEHVAVVGFGRFGRALVDLLSESGRQVRVWDPAVPIDETLAAPSLAALAAEAGTLVIAVPVRAFEATLGELQPHLGDDHLVIDVCSVKSGPESAMQRVLGARIPWVATHPLFGPASLARGERPLRVVVCPNTTHATAAQRAAEFYRSMGCEVVEMSAEAHDRAMAETHALAFFVAKGLLDLGAGEGVDSYPPSFGAIARTIETVRVDAGHLFRTIQHENPFASEARRRLIDALQNIDEQLSHDDRARDEPAALEIPALPQSPDLAATRELIDEVDRELVELLGRRMQLSRRAGRAKALEGRSVRDPAREKALLEERLRWAEGLGLEGEAVRDVFEAILRASRGAQRRS